MLPSDASRRVDAHLRALVAVEVRSPREAIATKLAHYREVIRRTGLEVGEVWYIDGGEVKVHPNASAELSPTAYPEALVAVGTAIRAWLATT